MIAADADALVASHGAAVWRTVVRVLGAHDQDAEDCFQDAFVGFWTRAPSSRAGHAEALLVSIATRRAIDALRRRIVARRRFPRAVEATDAANAAHGPPHDAAAGELADALVAALAELPEAQAVVFSMTQLDGIDHASVAAALNRSPNSVAVLLRRARMRLRAMLRDYDVRHDERSRRDELRTRRR